MVFGELPPLFSILLHPYHTVTPTGRRAFLGRRSAQGLGSLHPRVCCPVLKHCGNEGSGLSRKSAVKRVIWLTMAGGPSHLETFDPKPKLAEMHGQPMPESFTKGQQLAQLQGQKLTCFGPQHPFAKFGKNQVEICSLFPQIGSVIDDICLIRSMTTDAINHDPAHMFMNTGSQIAGRPSMGAWVTYGLGTEAEDLPGFVVLDLHRQGRAEPAHRRAAVEQRLSAQPLPGRAAPRARAIPCCISPIPPACPRPTGRGRRRDQCAEQRHDALVDDPEIATRIAQYEMAFRMQASVPDLMDCPEEAAKTVLELYGCKPGDGSFASNCLLARRLAERGVRFIQLYHRDWDHHGGVKEGVRPEGRKIDRACMALITDLKQRGMLDDTLIVWAGEFGRTPCRRAARDATTTTRPCPSGWPAAAFSGGIVYGATDDLGYAAVDNVTTVHDLHATMLHLLGIHHQAFSFKFQGLDARLSGVEGAKVIKSILG